MNLALLITQPGHNDFQLVLVGYKLGGVGVQSDLQNLFCKIQRVEYRHDIFRVRPG